MGMILGLYAVPASVLPQVLNDPGTVAQILAPDGSEAQYIFAEDPPAKPGCLGLLFPFLSRSRATAVNEPIPVLDLDPETVRSMDLDKSWHGIHFLLNGTSGQGTPPLDFLMVGGTEVGMDEWGYSPPRAFQPDEVQAITRALEPLTEDELRARFDLWQMTKLGIYPDIWDRKLEQDDMLGYCMEYFRELRQFIAETASRGEAMLVTLE